MTKDRNELKKRKPII